MNKTEQSAALSAYADSRLANDPPLRAVRAFEAIARLGLGEYEARVGFEWNTRSRLQIQTTDGMDYPFEGSTIPLARYTPVEMTIRADADAADFHQQVHDLALDCVNQGGIASVRTILTPRP